ncbi:hypothetical protein D3C84_805070 [compost metagenome]
MHASGLVINPDIQVVLLFAHPLAGQGDAHAQQAAFVVVALGVAEFHKAQWPPAGRPVGFQRRQAQHSVVLGLDVRPRQLNRFSGRCCWRGVG